MNQQKIFIFLTVGLLLFLFLFSITSSSLSVTSASSGGSIRAATIPSSRIAFSKEDSAPAFTMFNCTDCNAGYGDFAPNFNVTSVTTFLTVPSVSCAKKTPAQYSAFGIQMNGPSASDFAGALITAACSAGVVNYYADWFDASVFTGCTLCQINATWTPSAGDVVFLAMAYNNFTSRFTFVLFDLSSHQFYLRSSLVKDASPDFGECATDMYANSTGVPQPSVKFSPVSFANCLVNGRPVGFAPSTVTVFQIFCTDLAGTGYLAKPSALVGGQNFIVRFVATGP